MSYRIRFNRGHRRVRTKGRGSAAASTDLLALSREEICRPFSRLSGLEVVAVPIDIAGESDDHRPAPRHPTCEKSGDPVTCKVAWHAHVQELRRTGVSHWHRCPADFWCALVPLVHGDRCLAAYKLVCPASMPEEEFARRVELLAVLTENFATRRASLLAQFAASAGNDNGCAGACVDLSQDAAPDNGTLPPLAKRALEHIDAHLTDPDLSVSRIAQALNVSSTYLAHIFATHTGVRMSRLIAERRVEMAKRLLATTDREVKQIAFSVGFSNAAWFSQVFRNRTGQTPGQYRRTQRPA